MAQDMAMSLNFPQGGINSSQNHNKIN